VKIWKERDEKLKAWVHKADFTCRGKRYKPKAFTKDELEKTIIKIKSEALKKKAGLPADGPKITIGELVTEHLKDFNYEVEYYRRGKVVLENFRDFIGEDQPVEEIKAADLRGFIRHRKEQNPKLVNSSINKDLTYISKMLSSAREYFTELDNWTPIKLPWLTESTKRKDRVIYEAESAKLLAFLRDPKIHKGEKPNSPEIRRHYGDMLELALNTGMRWGELSRLEWNMVSIESGEINLPKRITKTDEPRTIPMNSRVKEILAGRERLAVWVFPRRDLQGPMLYYADRLSSIAKKLGLAYGREAGWTLHGTRHATATKMLAATGDFSAVQAILGHSDATMTARYSHPNQVRSRAAVDALLPATPVQKSHTKKRNRSEGR
jgi:integrase